MHLYTVIKLPIIHLDWTLEERELFFGVSILGGRVVVRGEARCHQGYEMLTMRVEPFLGFFFICFEARAV